MLENIHLIDFNVYIILTAILALCVGSFLNVVIYRLPIIFFKGYQEDIEEMKLISSSLPKGKFSLSYPQSSCLHCNYKIRSYDNIPVISYILLKGKCRNCGAHIPYRYPFIEILTAILSLVILISLGQNIQALCGMYLTWLLIAGSVIDLDYQILPDEITLLGLWSGLMINYFNVFTHLHDAVLGAAIGYLSLFSITYLYKIITDKTAMGNGDFKLLALFGAWFGLASILPIILLASTLTLLIIGPMIITKKKKTDTVFAFGPFLAIAGWLYMLLEMKIYYFYYNLSDGLLNLALPSISN